MNMITIEHVDKWYGEYHALVDINETVAQGEVVVVCGPSGSGKSTLIRTLNRLEPIQKGRIIVNGQDVHAHGVNVNVLRSGIGFVFQQFNLFPHLTAGENVALSPVVVKGMKKAEANDLARQMMAKVGLADKFDAYPDQLSGGQQQRVAIARALAMQPKVLLCDEITSALDPELVNEVLAVVKQLAAEGMTLIMVTHEMRFARDVGDQLVFMHQGLIHESGPAKDVFANPKTAELAAFIGAVQ